MAEKLIIELDLEKGDVSSAVKSLAKSGEEAGKKSASKFKDAFKKDISKGLKDITAKLTKATAAATALGAAIATGIGIKGVRAAQVQEDAINSLNTALLLSTNASLSASQSIQNFASELQRSTRFGDEVILQNAALIQSLGNLSEDGLIRATKAAADLSSALKIDLATASTLVGKAAAGEIGSFSRYGLIIEKGATQAQTFANALDAINGKFGGAAIRDVNTYSGSVQQLENSFGDLFEEIGFLITRNPAFIQTLKSTTKFLTQAGKTLNEFAKTFDFFQFITTTLVDFNNAFITYVIAPFELLLNVARLVQAGLNNYFALYTQAFAKFGTAVAFVLDKLNIGESLSSDLKIFEEAASETANETGQAVRSALENVFDFSISDKLSQENENLRTFFNEQIAIANEASNQQNEIQNQGIQRTQESLINLKGVFSEVGSAFSVSADAIAIKAAEANKKITKFAQDSGKQLRTGIAQAAGKAFAEFGAALVNGENALEAFTKSFLKSIGEQAVALGTRFILEGTAYLFAPGYQALAAPLISAGAALAAFGGAIGALTSQGDSGGGGGSAIQPTGTEQAFTNTTEELASPETETVTRPSTNVSINVQGSLVQQEELGQFITNTLNENFEKQGLTLTDARFA